MDPAGHAAGREIGLAGVEGDRGRVIPDADGVFRTLACDVAVGRRSQASHQAQRHSGELVSQRGPCSSTGFIDATAKAWHARAECYPCASSSWGPAPSAGAVGARLFQKGYDVTLVACGEHGLCPARAWGLVLEAPDETVTLRIPTVADPAEASWEGVADVRRVVLLAVKGQDHRRRPGPS